MASILNVKLIRQRFADFQLKLKVWRKRDRFRARTKKIFVRNHERIAETFDYFAETFENQLVGDCHDLYNEFTDYTRKSFKNEKALNTFLAGLSELAQNIEPDDLQRMIGKFETAHTEIHELYQAFVGMVKHECVMNVHFFAFTSLPDLIVRKNYTRKQFQLISKLLMSVKQQYLIQRAAEEAMNVDESKKDKDVIVPKTDANLITEEDLVEIQLLDDFLVSH